MKKKHEKNQSAWTIGPVCFLLIALIWGIFGQTLRHEFVNFDDPQYITQDPSIATGLSGQGLARIWTRPHLENWHPLTSLTNLIDCEVYGLNPAGHHATNVLLHTATALALFLVLRNLTGAFWRSALVAALFAVHPLRVESVAWVAERKDVLSGLFFVLTLGAYARYARRPFSVWRYAVVLLLFVAGLMSKSMLVTLPFVLLLLDFWPLGRFGTGNRNQGKSKNGGQQIEKGEPPQPATRNQQPLARLVLEKIPLLLLSLLFCQITLWAQQEALRQADPVSLPLRLLHALHSYTVYLKQTVFPVHLTLLYPYPQSAPPLWQTVLAILLLAGLSWLALAQIKKRPQLLVGWLWYLGMLVPVIGIVQVGWQSHADRYTYLPQIGILIAGVWLAAEALGQKPGRRTAVAPLSATLLAALCLLSYRQTALWKNSLTIWQHTLDHTENNYQACNNLGEAFIQRNLIPQAIIAFERAVAIRPEKETAYSNLGGALLRQDKPAEALPLLLEATRLEPNAQVAVNNLAIAYGGLNQPEKAAPLFERILRWDPVNEPALKNLAWLWIGQARYEQAIPPLKKLTALRPDQIQPQLDLAMCLERTGELEQACTSYKQALKQTPESVDLHEKIALLQVRLGNPAQAVAHFEEMLRIQPQNVSAQNNLAWLLATSFDKTVRNPARAVELAEATDRQTKGALPGMIDTLAAAYAAAGRFPEAIAAAQRALEWLPKDSAAASELQNRLKMYEAHTAYIEPEPPQKGTGGTP